MKVTAAPGFLGCKYEQRGSYMTECERLKKCPFFTSQMTNMPSVAELLNSEYCYGDKTLCARYRLASAGMTAPPDLLPNDTRRAREILAGC
jgi:hypothetical protein